MTFALTCIAWVFFRSETITDALIYLKRMVVNASEYQSLEIQTYLIVLMVFFVIIEWLGRRQQYAIETLFIKSNRWLRWTFYYALAMIIMLYGGETQTFIYFQF
ncbi:MAG: hypothetical protein HRU26_09175 [Psychroserpens sp.]|nr:hypothetical protein [Psychroserpens sp.]